MKLRIESAQYELECWDREHPGPESSEEREERASLVRALQDAQEWDAYLRRDEKPMPRWLAKFGAK